MQALRDWEIGVMFWAGRDTLAEIAGLGVRCGQLGVHGGIDLSAGTVAEWRGLIDAHQFTVISVICAYNGEDYADIPTVERTVGFIPPATRAERVQRTMDASDFAAALGVPGIGCHIGFVPDDTAHPHYIAAREDVRRVCDHAARHGQTFALETGQEPAHVLRAFIEDVGRDNLRINFDPANMILYGTGDPIEALDILGKYVVSVHCKDGDWPDKSKPGSLGTECPLGHGSVGMERFLAKLKDVGYRGALNIEREAENQTERIRDIGMAVKLLERLRG